MGVRKVLKICGIKCEMLRGIIRPFFFCNLNARNIRDVYIVNSQGLLGGILRSAQGAAASVCLGERGAEWRRRRRRVRIRVPHLRQRGQAAQHRVAAHSKRRFCQHLGQKRSCRLFKNERLKERVKLMTKHDMSVCCIVNVVVCFNLSDAKKQDVYVVSVMY
jgi:hypothetical protein